MAWRADRARGSCGTLGPAGLAGRKADGRGPSRSPARDDRAAASAAYFWKRAASIVGLTSNNSTVAVANSSSSCLMVKRLATW
jgi:hypothetical protein